MARELTPIQIESIRAARAAGAGVRETAREVGCSTAAVRKYGEMPDDECARLRTEKTVDAIEQIAKARALYLEHLMKPSVIAAATARDAVVVVGTLTDKHQLMTGAATSRAEVTIRQQAELMAAQLGVPVDEVLEEAQAIAAGSWDSWSPQ